ncbi:MAG: sialate O-acetylesterase [Bacteroidales bacterium]|nr:sialate O-acetylesterase [Bacteroidales bacterium]
MSKPGNNTIRVFIILSIVVNIVFFGYLLRKASWKIHQYRLQQKIEKSNAPQPGTVSYDLGRNEVFTKLPNNTNEIIMLGNSHTQNFEWHEIFGNVNIKNRGINGDITKGVLQRIAEVTESKPQKVFIEIGVNDLLNGFFMDSVFYNYERIIQNIRDQSPETRIYIQNLLPTGWNKLNTNTPVLPDIIELNERLKVHCSNNGFVYIDLFSKFVHGEQLNPLYDSGDHIHLNGTGYLLWCRLIEQYIYEK